MADVFGVERAGDVRLVGAFDDGSAIGEDGDVVVGDVEAEHVLGARDGAHTIEAGGEFVEADLLRFKARSDLHRVAATKRDGGKRALAAEKVKLAVTAAGAALG